MKKKIALFGGSFNPIHNHHLRILQQTLNKKLVDETWIIPSKNHPHSKQLTALEHRVNMIQLAIDDPRIKVCDIELKSDEINYTIRTIEKLKEQYPDNYEFYWTMGSDILHDMKNGWHGLEELLQATEFIIFKRQNYAVMHADEGADSSTHIRNLLAQEQSISGLVPKAVEDYITKHGLYNS